MDKILILISGILSVSLIMILIRYFGLKKQLRNISSQITLLAEGKTDKVLDITLLDRDLEMLAGEMNRYIERERGIVAESEKQEDYLKDSVANISHDLRTPLTVIL
ncbi:MAG: two-component sensor histidine kinase, partial [Lachnospiraceae bacterium]|nr:two-component sensor histidine kinase [Lachnospiraceae bacterium]